MMRTFQLFWRRAWDNLFHIIFINFIWFTLSLPLIFSLLFTLRALAPPLSPENERALSAIEADQADQTATPQAPPEPENDAPRPASKGPLVNWGPHMTAPLIFLGLSWIISCVASGFVFYATADIVTEYDFSGYFHVLRAFMKRGPILKSILAITVCTVTFIASVVNVFVYLHLAATRGVWYLVLAGVMLWFLLFVMMTFALTLPLAAQRDMKTFAALRLAALLSLSRPLRMLLVIMVAGGTMIVSLVSGAGVGFFILSLPAVLFNSEVRARLEEIEEREVASDADAAE